jgi:hypothetical protein
MACGGAAGCGMSHASSADRDRWARGIDILRRSGGHSHVPLLEAGRDGLVSLVFLRDRSGALPWGKIRRSTRPVLVLLGDDDEVASGPEGWGCASQLTQWAKGAIVHASGAEALHYRAAVTGAVECGRMLLIETASHHAKAWTELLPATPTLVIWPRGGVHPVETQRTTH